MDNRIRKGLVRLDEALFFLVPNTDILPMKTTYSPDEPT
jgi:hypothetical protein